VSSKRAASSKSKRKPKTSAQKAPTPDRIREIQSALQREGAFQGEPTGKWDDSTVQAMKNYQDKNGLTPSGKIDALTLQKLGLGSDTAGKGAPVPAAPAAAPPSPTSRTLQ
jgi:peptidoglycan hydrolase-like protein with peptidoglycan-binding domain